MSEKLTATNPVNEGALKATYRPVSASDYGKRSFSPHGTGQVPVSVPSLPSGVAPATPPPAPAQTAGNNTSHQSNGGSSQNGK